MARIAGVDLNDSKRTDIALTAIYGIGRNNVTNVLTEAQIEPARRIKDLNEEERNRIQKVLEASFKVEGDLRQEVSQNIARLKAIGAYRGLRHARNLPVRGQRTRSNARTKRGKRKTIGAMKKDIRAKLDTTKSAAPTTK